MNRNLKFFFSSFILSLLFFLGVNLSVKNLEDFFASEIYQLYNQPLLAQLSASNLAKAKKEVPEIGAESAISVRAGRGGQRAVIFEKNADEILPIASLTKLMTAFVALDYYDSSQEVRISQGAISQPENFGQLKIGEQLSVENLLYITLIESSNDSAYALSEIATKDVFVDLMNVKAKRLGLQNTHFTDPAGYDSGNRSSVKDLAAFSEYILENNPEIWEITTHPEFDLYDPDGVFHHQLLNTDEMLAEFPQIIGGKTGYTSSAGGCLVILLKNNKTGDIFFNVVLGAQDRFGDMKKLIEYAL